MDSNPRTPPGGKTGIRKRVTGVINSLVQRAFLNYMALVAVVGLATFVVLHYWTDLFRDEDTGHKKVLHQALAAAAVAGAAAATAFFARLL